MRLISWLMRMPVIAYCGEILMKGLGRSALFDFDSGISGTKKPLQRAVILLGDSVSAKSTQFHALIISGIRQPKRH